MALTARKLPQEIPTLTLINQGRNPAQRVNRNPLLRHDESQRVVIGKAVMWGTAITFVGLSLDYVVRQLHWRWLSERFLENIIEGAVFTLIIWAALNAREERLQRRSSAQLHLRS